METGRITTDDRESYLEHHIGLIFFFFNCCFLVFLSWSLLIFVAQDFSSFPSPDSFAGVFYLSPPGFSPGFPENPLF